MHADAAHPCRRELPSWQRHATAGATAPRPTGGWLRARRATRVRARAGALRRRRRREPTTAREGGSGRRGRRQCACTRDAGAGDSGRAGDGARGRGRGRRGRRRPRRQQTPAGQAGRRTRAVEGGGAIEGPGAYLDVERGNTRRSWPNTTCRWAQVHGIRRDGYGSGR